MVKMAVLIRLLLMLLLLFAFSGVARSKLSNKAENITIPGDIIIGGLFPIHKEGNKENQCGPLNEIPGYQYMEAMLYALEIINNRTDILPGIKLGTIIYDTCRSPTISADKTKEFIKMTLLQEIANITELAGIIGPFTSGNSIIVANFLRVFEIPQISYASLSVQLSNKNIYNYFFRTVPPDSFFAEALAVLLERLGWNYVSIIYSDGTYPETGTQEVVKALTRKGICVAKKHHLTRFPKDDDFDKAISDVVEEEKANVVIFVTIQRDARGLLEAKGRNPQAEGLTLLGSVSWSNRDDITNGLGKIAAGTLTFGHREGNIDKFKEYFLSLNLTNYKRNYKGWFKEFWQKQFNCSLGDLSDQSCLGNESLLNEHMEIAPVRVVINAVNAMAHAIHNMHQQLCPNQTSICRKMIPFPRTLLREFLKNVTFPDFSFGWPLRFNQFNEVEGNYTLLNYRETKTGEYSYDSVGTWTSQMLTNNTITGELDVNVSDIVWPKHVTGMPGSTCSTKCDYRSISVPSGILDPKCCWDCQTCEADEVIHNNTCVECEEDYVPDLNYTQCSKRSIRYVDASNPLAVTLMFFASLGLIAVLCVSGVFFVYRKHRLIKASGREMCYIMFVGIFAIFLVAIVTLVKPTQGLCYFRRLLTGISFTVCYAPLFMKIWRIHRIFKRAEQLRRISGLVGRRSLFLITAGLITVQGLFCILIFSADPPKLQETFYKARGELVLECSLTPSVFVAYLAYNVILMLLCTLYAFLTRNFPKNFNEAMYIGVTMYLTCVVWVVFLACFLNVGDSVSRAYWISGASVVIGWITLLGLYGTKLYQLYTREDFEDDKLVTWASSMFQRSESTQIAGSVENEKNVSASSGVTINATALEQRKPQNFNRI